MARDPKGSTVKFDGQQPLENMTKTLNKGLDEAVKKSTTLDKLYASIDKHVSNFTKNMNGRQGSSVLGNSLGSMGPGSVSATIEAFKNGTYGSGGGLSGGQRLALGTMGVGAVGMGMLPGTMQAVSQRLSAEAISMYSSGGSTPRSIITGANAMVGNGATSMGGPTMAAGQILSQGGYGFGSVSSNNIMNQVGGMSAVSGMSNQAVAGSYASQNGMMMMRMGIRFRDASGNVRPPNEIVNELYNRLYRGGNPKNPELIYNPGSFEHQTIMAVAQGDPQRFELYASMLIARAKNKKPLTAGQMQDAQGMLKTMGIKNSIQGTAFQFNTAQNRLLGASESGAVAGYQGSMQIAADVSNGMAALGETLPPVINALSAFKGVLESMPGMGGVGGTLSGAAGMATNALMMRSFLGGGGGAGAFKSLGGKGLGFAGKMGLTGLGLGIAGTAIGNGAKPHSGRSRAGKAMQYAGMASILNVFGPEIGVPAMALAGLFGAATGEGVDMGQSSMDTSGGSGKLTMEAMPPFKGSYPITSGIGMRVDPNNPKATQHHNGTDYAMPVGTPVLAAADGVVDTVRVQPGNKRSYGRYIVLKHNGYYTYYAHLSAALVRPGQKVRQGEVIGKSGGKKGADGAGSSTGPHLHFEVRKDKSSSAPMNPFTSIFGKIKSAVSNLFGGHKPEPEMRWSSPVGSSSLSQVAMNQPRLADLLNSGDAIGFADLSSGGSAKTAGDIQSILAFGGNTVKDNVSGDTGGMAFNSRKGLISALYAHGFRGKALETAFAVALAESGGRNVKGDVGLQTGKWGPSIGPFQIRSLKNPGKYGDSGKWRDGKKLLDPNFNIEAAKAISHKGTNWKAWTTYTSGSFTKFLDDAQTAARQAGIPVNFYGTGGGTEEGLHYLHPDEAVLPKLTADRLRNRPAMSGGGTINVNMTVNIAKAGEAEVQVLLNKFKSAIENDATIKSMGAY